jgi:hypothetical protein
MAPAEVSFLPANYGEAGASDNASPLTSAAVSGTLETVGSQDRR